MASSASPVSFRSEGRPTRWTAVLPQAARLSPKGTAVALILVCALEWFIVQELTLGAMHHRSWGAALLQGIVRMTLDLTLASVLILTLPRAALLVAFVSMTAFFTGISVYESYYRQPLSMLVLLNQTGEGVSVAPAILELIELHHGLLLLLLGAKLFLLYRAPFVNLRVSWRAPAAYAAIYIAVLLACDGLIRPLSKIASWESVGGIGSYYGYTPTWLAELAYVDNSLQLERALEAAERERRGSEDRLTGVEAAFPVSDRLVFLQVESLDEAALDFEIAGREVTPNLNRLAKQALRFAVQAPKGTGSCDADFRALMAQEPSHDVPVYKIAGYPYTGSWPAKLKQFGYRSVAIHGVTGEFFNRRPAYVEMGFDELLFKEEFQKAKLAPVEGWTVDDAALLSVAAKRLQEATRPEFHLVITATSHIPYPLPESKKVFFPSSTARHEAYFDSIHYVDEAIGKYVASLPEQTTLVLYGDHVSQSENAELSYYQMEHSGAGCAPLLIVSVGEDLSGHQKTGRLARSCELTALDVWRFVHANIEEALTVRPLTTVHAATTGAAPSSTY